MAPHAPKSTPGEWLIDPFNKSNGLSPSGPGFRLPFYIISPWTRNGGVFTEHSSHESQILFLEEWSKAHGKPWKSKEMNPWRRHHMSNLVKAFDFSNPDYSTIKLDYVPEATKDLITGFYNGAFVCIARFLGLVTPKVPYGKQNEKEALRVEAGYKPTRGDLTEGRFLVFETNGRALSHSGHYLGSSKACDQHNGDDQLFVIHWQGSAPRDNRFKISTPGKHPRYIASNLKFTSNPKKAAVFEIVDLGNGKGYTVTEHRSNKKLTISENGSVKRANYATFSIFSVTK